MIERRQAQESLRLEAMAREQAQSDLRRSFKEAALSYRKAVDQGLASAMTNLSNLYELGEGVPEDWVESAKWRLKSAQLGDSGGQSALGAAYEFGIGVPQNRKLAIQWDQEAAAQGNAQSAYYAKWLSNPGNFIGFRNAKERSLFLAMPDSPIFAEPKGAIFHNSAERLRYLSNAAQSAPSASGISTWHTVCAITAIAQDRKKSGTGPRSSAR
jgi:TPR repeat protein